MCRWEETEKTRDKSRDFVWQGYVFRYVTNGQESGWDGEPDEMEPRYEVAVQSKRCDNRPDVWAFADSEIAKRQVAEWLAMSQLPDALAELAKAQAEVNRVVAKLGDVQGALMLGVYEGKTEHPFLSLGPDHLPWGFLTYTDYLTSLNKASDSK